MKRKKGFVLIETIIVTSVLIVSLMLVYQNFVKAYGNEKTKIRYDDMADIYKVFYLKDYLETNTAKGVSKGDIPLNDIGTHGSNSDYIKGMDRYYSNADCPIQYNELACDKIDNNGQLCKILGIEKIYIVRYNYLEVLKANTLASSSKSCFGGDVDLATYVSKMGITDDSSEYGFRPSQDKFQLIVKFNKDFNGESIKDNYIQTVYSYASININMNTGYSY